MHLFCPLMNPAHYVYQQLLGRDLIILLFFPYEDTKDKFNIPHDLKILSQIFNVENGLYNNSNKYWKSYAI